MVKMLHEFWYDKTVQDLGEFTLWMAFVALTSAALFISSSASVQFHLEHHQCTIAPQCCAYNGKLGVYPETSPAFPDALITAPRGS